MPSTSTLPAPRWEDLPLALPNVRQDFAWNGRSATIVAQRRVLGSNEASSQFFYLITPEGTAHNLATAFLRLHLTHPPREFAPEAIALAFEKEPYQHEADHLHNLILCLQA